MAFIKYTEKGRSFAAKVSVSTTGLISFNDGSRRRFQLDKYKFCVLYFDEETHRIGIELTNNELAEGIRKLRLRPTGADVAAKSFIDFFQIPVVQTKIFEVEQDAETQLLTIDLEKGKIRNAQTDNV